MVVLCNAKQQRGLNVLFIVLVLLAVNSPSYSQTATSEINWQKVEHIIGKAGALQNGVYKIGLPRHDLQINIGTVRLAPTLALNSWFGFTAHGNDTMVMGDLVLLASELAPAMQQLVAGGLEISAVHNHVASENPQVMYMHFSGSGDVQKLASAIKSALDKTATPISSGAPAAPTTAIDQQAIEKLLGRSGKVNGGVLQFAIPRAEKILEMGMEIPPAIGMATAINFQPTAKSRAAITGDFVLTENEVNPVLRTLIENDIAVTALHNHMLHETPRLFFMHFWANDDSQKLAKGLRAALDRTNSQL